MDVDKAVAYYEKHRDAMKKYYETHKEQISEQRKAKYRASREGQPKKRMGRPPKRVVEGGSVEGV